MVLFIRINLHNQEPLASVNTKVTPTMYTNQTLHRATVESGGS